MRFVDLLRAAVLLSAGAGTALAVVAIAGASAEQDTLAIAIGVGWWVVAAAGGLWLGRRLEPTPGIGRLLAAARASNTLPDQEVAGALFNRLWPLGVVTVVCGALAVLIPAIPAIAAGYAIGVALTWRRQAAAVQAIEDRDGVRFHLDRSSPFGAPELVRTPWARKIAPTGGEPEPV